MLQRERENCEERCSFSANFAVGRLQASKLGECRLLLLILCKVRLRLQALDEQCIELCM
mgnify:FL=1|jgi:hypothetical protein